jgi:hypothetical protein
MEMREQQALMIIEEMISKTKEDIRDNGFFFLLWGWLVLIAALSNYYLLVYTGYLYHSAPWLLMPLGGVATMLISMQRRSANLRVRTYVEELFRHAMRAFVIAMVVVCMFMPMGNQWAAFYPTIMILYGIWLYISGGMLKFRPLMFGAMLNWILAAAGFVVKDTPTHLLLISAGVLGGYIIPGYLLNRKSRVLNVQ